MRSLDLRLGWTDKHGPGGYPESGRWLTEALTALGVEVTPQAQTVLWYGSGAADGLRWSSAQRCGIMSMWESSELPQMLRSAMREFDFAVVPSSHSADLFRPFVDPVHIVPCGVAPDVCFPPPGRPDRPFTVISAAHSIRKGIDELVAGFRLFQAATGADSRLILKGIGREVSSISRYQAPDVILHRDVWSRDELRERFFWEADVYVSASYGEGWDLPAFEALACGVPVIVPDHTAYADWNHLAQGVLEGGRAFKVDGSRFGAAGVWYRADPVEIADCLGACFADYESWYAAAMVQGATVRAQWSWQNSAEALIAALDPLEPLEGPVAEADVAWAGHTPVRALRAHGGYDVGGVHGTLVAGESYKFPLEVARVLQEAGYVEVEN